jgi:hypothetical protein
MLFRLFRNLSGKTDKKAEVLRSDVFNVSPVTNTILEGLFSAEATWLRWGWLPFGISLICVAQKYEA